MRRFNANPEHKIKHLEHLKNINANPEIQAKRLERLKIYTSTISHGVSVLDSQTNETNYYSSMYEAAIAIGVSKSTIGNAFRKKGEYSV